MNLSKNLNWNSNLKIISYMSIIFNNTKQLLIISEIINQISVSKIRLFGQELNITNHHTSIEIVQPLHNYILSLKK